MTIIHLRRENHLASGVENYMQSVIQPRIPSLSSAQTARSAEADLLVGNQENPVPRQGQGAYSYNSAQLQHATGDGIRVTGAGQLDQQLNGDYQHSPVTQFDEYQQPSVGQAAGGLQNQPETQFYIPHTQYQSRDMHDTSPAHVPVITPGMVQPGVTQQSQQVPVRMGPHDTVQHRTQPRLCTVQQGQQQYTGQTQQQYADNGQQQYTGHTHQQHNGQAHQYPASGALYTQPSRV